MNIHELNQTIDEILTENGGELTEEVEALLNNKEALEQWLTNATRKYLNESAQLEAIKAEKKRIEALKAEREKLLEGLENTIGRLLGEGNKRDLGFAKLGWRKSEAVEIAAGKEDQLPDAYLIPKWVPDKTQIKADLKQGVTIPFCELVERQNLQIK